MALNTYSALQTTIANFLNRDDLTSVIPDFISLVESKLNREVRTRDMIQRSTASITGRYFPLPTDFLAPHHIQLNTDPPVSLNFVPPHHLDQLREDKGAGTGRPCWYTIIGSELEFLPP